MDRRIHRLAEPHPSGGYTEIIEWPDGRRAYMLDGEFHRADGPAFEGADGQRIWHLHGREHRLDGPAVEYPDGEVEYWIDGARLDEHEFYERPDTSPQPPDRGQRAARRSGRPDRA